MDGLRAVLDLLLPTPCAGCAQPGAPWCPACAALLGAVVRVRPPQLSGGPPAYTLGAYAGPVRAGLLAYKERGRRCLAAPLAAALAAALAGLLDPRDEPVFLVPVPSRRGAAARRGGQHVAVLATRASALLAARGHPVAVAAALRMARGVSDSVGLTPRARRANLAGRVLLRAGATPPPGSLVVLVDDVLTTGATAAECAAVLRRSGVELRAVVAIAAAGQHRG